jgi:heme/copper-type cytochrome/quinol oxidase subunit 2
MKKMIAAPLCSGLVIPGLGQIVNQQIRKGIILLGLVFLLFVAGAVKLAFIISALSHSADLQEPSRSVAESGTDFVFMAALVAAFAILWVYSVTDAFLVAYRSGRSVKDKDR